MNSERIPQQKQPYYTASVFHEMRTLLYTFGLGILLFLGYSCKEPKDQKSVQTIGMPVVEGDSSLLATKLNSDSIIPIAKDFDFPVGKPDGKGYYNAQPFGTNNHLGEDWNGLGGGNTDLGDSIYAIANGKVIFCENIGGGWGNVIRIIHVLENGKNVESVYAHCESVSVTAGDLVDIGQKIGAIGTAEGVYLAHLHLELRDVIGMPIGVGYSTKSEGYLNPTAFLSEH